MPIYEEGYRILDHEIPVIYTVGTTKSGTKDIPTSLNFSTTDSGILDIQNEVLTYNISYTEFFDINRTTI